MCGNLYSSFPKTGGNFVLTGRMLNNFQEVKESGRY